MGWSELVGWVLAVLVLVTILWPLNVPVLALAYKVRNGAGPMPHEPGPFWLRTAAAAFGLMVLSVILVFLNSMLVDQMAFPPGPIQLMLLLAYLAGAVFYLFWMFAYEDVFEALSVLALYVFLPGFVLLLLGWVFNYWKPITWAASWLQPNS